MAKPSKLRFFDPEKKRLDVERLLNRSVANYVKHRLSFDFLQKSHLGRLHLRSLSSSHYPRLMTIHEDGDEYRFKHREFCLSR